MLYSLRKFSRSEVAQERHKILIFYKKYGEKATKEAFGADRKLIHVWKKRLARQGNQLMALVPSSTRPRRVRKMTTEPRIIEFIRDMRRKHPRIGKEKIKPFLDKYCKEITIPSVSESTIGKIIKRHKFFYQRAGRIYHDPNSQFALNAQKRKKRLRVKHPPRHTEFGHFQADSSFLFLDGMRRYIISAIDSKLKFAFSSCYSYLSSRNVRDFIKRLEMVYPLSIKSVQTDNGPEFLGDFDEYLKSRNIPHYFSYPRCPKINGCVERFNRTLKEEFVENNYDVISDIELFRKKLVEYLVFYNTERPHKSLALKSPIDHLILKGAMSKMFATYTLT